MLSRVKEIKDAVQQIVDKGVTSVEEIHKSIARIPFQHLEAAAGEQVKPYTEPVTKVQDTIVGSVYEVIRKVNRQVGELADEVLHKLGEGRGQTPDGQEAKPSA
jgi:hypothetical protein